MYTKGEGCSRYTFGVEGGECPGVGGGDRLIDLGWFQQGGEGYEKTKRRLGLKEERKEIKVSWKWNYAGCR